MQLDVYLACLHENWPLSVLNVGLPLTSRREPPSLMGRTCILKLTHPLCCIPRRPVKLKVACVCVCVQIRDDLMCIQNIGTRVNYFVGLQKISFPHSMKPLQLNNKFPGVSKSVLFKTKELYCVYSLWLSVILDTGSWYSQILIFKKSSMFA